MKSLSLFLRIAAILAAVGAAALFFISQNKLEEKQNALESSQAATKGKIAELENANSQISSLQSGLDKERESLAETKDQLEDVRAEMYTAKKDVSRTQKQLIQSKAQISEFKSNARQIRGDLVKNEKLLAAMASSKEIQLAKSANRIKELEEANYTLEQEVSMAKAKIGSSKQSYSNTSTESSAADYIKTVAANTATPALVASVGMETTIASISASDGIIILRSTPGLDLTSGAQLTLIQDFKALGKIQITQLTNSYVVASVLPGANIRGLSAGDSVQLLR